MVFEDLYTYGRADQLRILASHLEGHQNEFSIDMATELERIALMLRVGAIPDTEEPDADGPQPTPDPLGIELITGHLIGQTMRLDRIDRVLAAIEAKIDALALDGYLRGDTGYTLMGGAGSPVRTGPDGQVSVVEPSHRE